MSKKTIQVAFDVTAYRYGSIFKTLTHLWSCIRDPPPSKIPIRQLTYYGGNFLLQTIRFRWQLTVTKRPLCIDSWFGVINRQNNGEILRWKLRHGNGNAHFHKLIKSLFNIKMALNRKANLSFLMQNVQNLDKCINYLQLWIINTYWSDQTFGI